MPTDACERHPGIDLLRETSALAKAAPAARNGCLRELLKTATGDLPAVELRGCDTHDRFLAKSADDCRGRKCADRNPGRTGPVDAREFPGQQPIALYRAGRGYGIPGYVSSNSIFCTNVLTPRVDCVCLIELIWSYWHEGGDVLCNR